MEIAGAAVTSATRIGLNVVSAHKRPLLEVYHEVRNCFGPPEEYTLPDASGKAREPYKTRHQDIFVQFTLVNVGGVRAENVLLELKGGFDRNHGWSLKDLGVFGTRIPQLAPSQILLLFRIDEHDLYVYPPEGGKPTGMKDDGFEITLKYGGPSRGANMLLRFVSRHLWRKEHQYTESYVFAPRVIRTSLPAAEYAG